MRVDRGARRGLGRWREFLFRGHSVSGALPRQLSLPSFLCKVLSIILSTRSTAAPLSRLPQPPLCAHTRACTHTHARAHTRSFSIHPPPWSPWGFKVLMLIRSELT